MANKTFIINGRPYSAKDKKAAITKLAAGEDFESISELDTDSQLVHCSSIWPTTFKFCPLCGKKTK